VVPNAPRYRSLLIQPSPLSRFTDDVVNRTRSLPPNLETIWACPTIYPAVSAAAWSTPTEPLRRSHRPSHRIHLAASLLHLTWPASPTPSFLNRVYFTDAVLEPHLSILFYCRFSIVYCRFIFNLGGTWFCETRRNVSQMIWVAMKWKGRLSNFKYHIYWTSSANLPIPRWAEVTLHKVLL
jgi:hypothetical protein